MASGTGGWSHGQFWGWGLGGALGGAVTGIGVGILGTPGPLKAILEATLIDGTFGALGGFIAGAGGYGFSFLLDEPHMKWDFRSSFLFATIFTMLISAVLAFPAISYVRGHSELHVALVVITSFIGSFVAAGVCGVINNFFHQRIDPQKKPQWGSKE